MKNRRGNPGLQGRLLEKSIEAYILSLETINRLSIKYRVETFAYLICNAWELLLKAKIISDTKDKKSIFYDKKNDEPLRSIALRDCIKRGFPSDTDPTRRNLERIVDLRDESVHLVISKVPPTILALFQSCVLNYHRCLINWFEISLSERVSIGMMTIVYDFSPEQFDLQNPILRRHLGKEIVDYLVKFQNNVQQEYEFLNKPAEYSIDINYKLALVQKPGEADIILAKGEPGLAVNFIEIPKDPSRTHPYRQSEVVESINKTLGKKIANAYAIQCVMKVYKVEKRPEFYYKATVKNSTGQYSQAFTSWILREYEKDNMFFDQVRASVKQKNG